MTKETKKWWNTKGREYQNATNIPVGIHYGPGAPFEDELKLLGNIKGKHILEIGCGGAQCGIAMAQKGAIVIGVDISKTQLEFAKELARKNKVQLTLYQGDVKRLPQIKSKSQDIVFSTWALFYIDDLNSCFKEVNRVLKSNGKFILAMPNPYYSIIDSKKLVFQRSYFKTGKHTELVKTNKGKMNKFVCYNTTLSYLINLLINNGFILEKYIEPDSRKHYKKDPWYGIWEFQPELMKLLPPTIIFVAKKK
jgi:ubiquinone/menaquinone biosynthesis C-methylase UbiE